MSLARKATRGALWTVISSVVGRAVGVVGTLIITRFLHPEAVGEVSDAAILCITANVITIWGFGQYALIKARGAVAIEVAWHATVFYFVLGTISIGSVVVFREPLTRWLGAPDAAAYVPALALAIFIRRLGAMPERMLTQRMEFRPSALSLGLGEASFTATAVPLAALGFGGWSLVIANLVKSCVAVGILIRAAGFRSWATPAPLRLARIRDMLRFGVPLGVQGFAQNASRTWDNLAISYYFGPGALGTYNMAYNLADIPAVQVGEQIGLVLLPSMAELPTSERRARALERSTALLSLIIFPLAIGLGVVAYPLIGLILPDNEWQEVAPLLAVLASLSVFRPISWVLSAYLQAESKTARLMLLDLAQVALLMTGIAALSQFGLRAAACAVGIAFGASAIGGVLLVMREGPSPARLVAGFVQPLLACAVMALVAWLVHRGLWTLNIEHHAIHLAAEIVAGAVAYVAAALVICRENARYMLTLVGQALRRDPI